MIRKKPPAPSIPKPRDKLDPNRWKKALGQAKPLATRSPAKPHRARVVRPARQGTCAATRTRISQSGVEDVVDD
jgi:hypothetical protein